MGSIFESSHLPLRLWLQVIHMMCAGKKGVSTNEVQRTLRCSMKTAWFLTHRIREMMNDKPGVFFSPIGGEGRTVEADETYIGPAAKNRAYEAPKPKLSVMSLVERGGAVRSFHVPNVTAQLLHPIIAKHAHRDSRFITDESNIYAGLGWNFNSHQTVNHSIKEYVRGEVYTNTAEGYFSILKRGIYGVYQHVSEAHLHRYLNEFDFRYSYRIKTGYDDVARADLALRGAKNKRLTYENARGARPA
jgi:transposase-like protein